MQFYYLSFNFMIISEYTLFIGKGMLKNYSHLDIKFTRYTPVHGKVVEKQ